MGSNYDKGVFNQLMGISVSTGSVYGFCKKFAESCSIVHTAIEQELLNSHEICTDATPIKTDGKQTYIRNFSTERCVLYCEIISFIETVKRRGLNIFQSIIDLINGTPVI